MFTASVCIVIPAYNEGERLPGLLADLVEYGVRVHAPSVEFLVVDDGSSPKDLQLERRAVEKAFTGFSSAGVPHRAKLLKLPRNFGKGSAIRRGWQEAAADADWLGFLDADGAVPASEVWRLVAMLDSKRFDLLAGARIRMAGHRIHRSLVRHLQGRIFATLAERWVPNGFYDTQCGIKLVKASRLRPLMEHLQEDRWLLDIELITLISKVGGDCIEEPIDWREPGSSKVVPILDPIRMTFGLWHLRRRLAHLSPSSMSAYAIHPRTSEKAFQ